MLAWHSRQADSANAGLTALPRPPGHLILRVGNCCDLSGARYTYRLVLQSRFAHQIPPICSINKIYDDLAEPKSCRVSCLKPSLLGSGMIKGPACYCARPGVTRVITYSIRSPPTLLHAHESAGPYFRINANSTASVLLQTLV
jgi:hypothetical protein